MNSSTVMSTTHTTPPTGPFLAVVGDVHGALAQLFAILDDLEAKVGPIVGVLQAGDMGVFGPDSPLDKATRRFAAHDPTELGLAPYVAGTWEAPRPVWFTRGNHEDFDLLRRSGSSVDPWGSIMHLPDGEVSEVEGLRVLAIGGIPGREDDPRGGKHFRTSDVENAALIAATSGPVDILLTHAGPQGCSVEGNELAGSWDLLAVLDVVQPRWHFFGHHGHPPRPRLVGATRVVPLNQPDVLRIPGRDGGIGLLEVTGEGRFWFRRNGEWVEWDGL